MNFQGVPILKNYDVIWKVHFSVGVERISHKKWLNLEFLGVKLFTKIKNYSVNCHPGGHVMIVVIPACILQNSSCFPRDVKIFMFFFHT